MPLMIFLFLLYAFLKKTDVLSSFTQGAKNGIKTLYNIYPTLLALFISIGVFKSSGLLGKIEDVLRPLFSIFKIPSELIGFMILRPISGSGCIAYASEIFSSFGPDSFLGKCVSVIMGSSETTFYVICIYFGACKVKNIRHTLKCALLADVFSMIVSIIVCSIYF